MNTLKLIYWFLATLSHFSSWYMNGCLAGKRRKTKRGGKKNKELDPDVIIETQEFDYIEVKRIVQSYVKTPILHLFFGRVPQDHWQKDVNYFYFLRRNNTPIGKLY